MRELKSILTNAGLLKRVLIDLSEEDICLKALTGINLPKLTLNDIPLFT